MHPIASSSMPAAMLIAWWTASHRRSVAVRTWEPSVLPTHHIGDLSVRSGGSGDNAILLLHGLISTGEIFGKAFDPLAEDVRLVAPDLLGFGGSINHDRTSFTLDDHLGALDSLLDSGVLGTGTVSIGAHSMGSTVALAWAKRHPERIDSIVCWGAPIQPSRDAAVQQLSGSLMAELFALNTNVARQTCAVSCRHRTAAGWLAALAEPALPTPIARAVPLHTWPAYRDSLEGLVLEVDWSNLLQSADTNGIPVHLVWGDNDAVPDMAYVRRLTSQHHRTTTDIIADADHRLPLTHPQVCVEHLRARTKEHSGP